MYFRCERNSLVVRKAGSVSDAWQLSSPYNKRPPPMGEKASRIEAIMPQLMEQPNCHCPVASRVHLHFLAVPPERASPSQATTIVYNKE